MKHRNKVKRLQRKQRVFDEKYTSERGFKKPGSVKKPWDISIIVNIVVI